MIAFQAVLVMISAAGERRDVQVEHVLRVAEDLQRQREVRRVRRGVDEAGARASAVPGCRPAAAPRDGSRSPTYHWIHLSSPLRREQLRRLHVGERAQRLLREELHPAAGAPAEQVQALGLQPLLEDRRQLLLDRRFLVVDSKKNGMPKTLNASSTSARPTDVEERGLQDVELGASS